MYDTGREIYYMVVWIRAGIEAYTDGRRDHLERCLRLLAW